MSIRLVWIKYNDPFKIEDGDFEKFNTADEAIQRGCELLREHLPQAFEIKNVEMAELWKLYHFVHKASNYQGFKIQLFFDRSYLNVFNNDYILGND